MTTEKRSMFGLRERPGRVPLMVMHLPLQAYAHDKGHLRGHVFVQFTHLGRRSGREYSTVAMVLAEDEATGEVVVCSAWDTDWCRNLRERPATSVTIGRTTYVPQQRFLDGDEALQVVTRFAAAHPHRVRLLGRVLGWGDLHDEGTVREVVRTHQFVGFRPQPAAAAA